MTQQSESDLEQGAAAAVTALLSALRAGDFAAYRALLSDADKEILTEEALRQSTATMADQAGALLDFRVEGVVLHAAAGHAAVHVTLNFEKAGPKTELYHLSFEDGAWLMDFDLAGMQ